MPRVTMPQLGESVAEGTIGRWLKQVGDHVTKYEPIVEVITDKVNAEVPSPFEGVLSEILVEEGATVPNGAEIAVIQDAGSAAVATASQVAATPADAVQAAGPTPTPAAPGPAAQAGDRRKRLHVPHRAVAQAGDAVPREPREAYQGPVTPAVRRMARENGVDLADVRGTGHGGRVTRDDVIAFVEARRSGAGAGSAVASAAPSESPAPVGSLARPAAPSPATAAPPQFLAPPAVLGEGDELKPLTQMRKGIAAQMTRAAAVPMAYLTLEVDMSGAVAMRERSKDEYRVREGIGLSYVAIVTKAVVDALRRHPDLNAHWTDQGLVRRSHVNVGVAVAVDDGLIVPVIHDADRLSISGINRGVVDLAARARSGRLRIEELQGGTFTVDNTGWFGSIVSAPIVNVPEVAILTMEAIQRRPVVIGAPGGEAIAIRPMMYICSAFDHRATDGAQMGRFMQDVKQWLESVDERTAIW